MKTNYKLIVKLASLALLAMLTMVFTQCVPSNTKQIGGGQTTEKYTSDPVDTSEEETLVQAQVSEGIKSHEQILHAMSSLTGIPVTNGNVKNVYNEVSTSLPTDNEIKVFLPSHQLAITKLAAEYCNELVNNTTARMNVWVNLPSTVFTTAASSALSMNNRDIIIDDLILAFWGDVITTEERNTAEDELHQLIEDLLLNEANNSTTTRNVIKGVCTSALASAHVTLL